MSDRPENMIERLARVIYLQRYAKEGGIWEAVETKDVWYGLAEGILTEMRDPSSTMCGYAKHRIPGITREQAHEVWFCMIEEAISQTPKVT